MRPLYLTLGVVNVGLGVVGAFLPVMPSTVFFIVALWCFKRSSPPLEAWLLDRSPALRDWDRERAMTRRSKTVALAALWFGIGASAVALMLRGRPLWVSGLLLACAVGVTMFLLRVRTKDA